MRDHPAFHQDFEVQGGDFTRAGEVSCLIKNLLKELGIGAAIVRRVAIASFEAEMNVIMYAVRGTVGLTVTPSQIQIVVDDQGPGIPDIEQAMTEGFSTATPEMRERGFGAGMGLPNIRKNADTFRLVSDVGSGTRLEITIAVNGQRT